MQAFQADIISSIMPALEGSAALFLGLILTQPKPVAQWQRFLALIAVFGATCGTLHIFGLELSWFFLLLLPVILASAVKFLFSALWMYSAITGFLTGALFGAQRLIVSLSVPDYMILLGTLVIGILCWRQKASILPEMAEIPIISDKKQSRRFTFSLALVAISFCEILLWICYLLSVFLRIPKTNRIYFLIFTLAALITLLVFARRLAFSAMERIEALIDKQYQAELLNFMQIIRSQRHDFNFHMQAISGMIEGKRYQECQDYVQQMAKSTRIMNDILPLHNPAISAMLNSFREIAMQKAIQFDVSIYNDLSKFPCSVYETNTIIGNLIQNAIDEVEKNDFDRWINILILKRGGDIIIKVTNPCFRSPQEFKDIFRPGYSTKQSHEGIGLTTVARLVSRYGGSVHPEFDNGTISFIVRIAS